MSRRQKIRVYLPNPVPFVELPWGLAATLRFLVDAGSQEVTTLELHEKGLVSVYNHIRNLRKKGAIIETRRGPAMDKHGNVRQTIAHYIYHGWSRHDDE